MVVEKRAEGDTFAITLDIDWVPDFVIDFVADLFREHNVRATWFVTHASPAVERLRDDPSLFELGIHPNFLSGSTHGKTPDEVLQHCMDLVPEAVSMRSHALFQSSPLFAHILWHSSITIDLSLLLAYAPGLQPGKFFWQGRELLRIPFFWEDDIEMERPQPVWRVEPMLALAPGLKIFNFHPIHIYLNSPSIQPYTQMKRRVPELLAATASVMEEFVNPGAGARTFFIDLVQHMAQIDQSFCVRQIADRWRRCGEADERL